ncbi:PEGA domain protein [Planctomycetes bacterium Poly30]|uniref:PEGA domain protein n=1 Tax=Saltatorellus ferox TaxID=2528018 RepID=A0A518EU19_9BACT|nr:PEGA domain protein [Planctomycetes bacterium Poly30]
MRTPSSTPLATLALLALAIPMLQSCISGRRPIVLDSTPRGALVIVDGEDSGHSTPCTIQLSDSARTFEFRLPGYATEERYVRVGGRRRVVYWRDAITDYRTWAFPLWLSAEDFFFPIKEDGGEMPNRIHVRLKRSREPVAFAN